MNKVVEVVEDFHVLEKLQKNLEKLVKRICPVESEGSVGYQGGSKYVTLHYSPQLNIWFSTETGDNKYWNAFGIGKPKEKGNAITVEINLNFVKTSRRTAGAFAYDLNGHLLLLHRGNIGGGQKGIGKQTFLSNSRSDLINVRYNRTLERLCLVGDLHSKFFSIQLKNFIMEVDRIKNHSPASYFDTQKLNSFSFTKESFGTKSIKKSESIEVKRTHGIVVNSLAKALTGMGVTVGSDSNRDLFIHSKKKIRQIFEIKRSTTAYDLYTAIGQLIIYSIPIENKPLLTLVLPCKIKERVEAELKIMVLACSIMTGMRAFQSLNILRTQ
ncbi:hypothetical protein [Chitinophaga pinensis]|uniref:Uncharacterized protein n=1 Tax=Chitinophaga pinensis TaxID=79329 RepID=A0A5C6LJZ6_9BACT|nr:hypothetical protein [Chitinophaga pinensis]TWV91499.1 hypothetical protein FEF09_28745 [Chitinophaga pinensis]